MKYPQLVSSRAVSEISDWLIRRLEDLDIEQPSVYSRLLLSLLHTPFKVNAIDLLEIPQLKDCKQPYHLLNKNNDELKRLAAVESLLEVSAEGNKSNIISLVNELHLKLRKVESSCEENAIIGRGSSAAIITSPVTSPSSKFYKNLKKIKRNHGSENPTKNYYLAFPALSSKKTSATISSGGSKVSSSVAVGDTKKDSNLQLLCWSDLMSSARENVHSLTPLSSTQDADKLKNVVKQRRSRRYGRQTKRCNRSDVQCNSKSYDVYEGATFSPKAKNDGKKHQRNQFGKKLDERLSDFSGINEIVPTASSKSQTKNFGDARNKNLSVADDAEKVELPYQTLGSVTAAPWDMDFKGHWEMADRDLISEFIQKQHHLPRKTKIKDLSFATAKSTNQVDQAVGEEEDVMLMKFLPMKLMDDSLADDQAIAEALQKAKEAQSISSLQSKFDENIKALWNDVDDPLTKPLTHKNFGEGNASLVSSFASEKNSLSLFNFNEEVIAPCTANPQIYSSNAGTDFMSIADFDYNNNKNSGRGAVFKSHHSSSTVSPGAAEKFIKSGTNLQTSIWSEGEFSCEPESLIYKDVVDHTDDAIYKKMKSIGAEMKNWQNSCAHEDEDDITLFNHSDVSAFKRFRPLIASTIIRANYHPNNMKQTDRSFNESTDDSENLLTSEKTHFSPIIRDGHTFVIDSNWDEIKWERSPSGSLMLNNKRYMKWNNPQQLSEDFFDNSGRIDLESIENDATDFAIKFVVKDENDKGCQTDVHDFLRASTRSLMEINEEYCKRKIYDEYFKGINENTNKWRYHLNADDSNDYSFFSVNRVKPNDAAKTLQDILISSNSSSSSICTITSSSYDTSAVDPFESWRSIKIDNGGMLDSEYKQSACMHSLWEQCATCTRNDYDPYEVKSIPANRMLKDELRMDGDEIMNVIQNLYITGDFCDDEEKEDDEDCEDMNHFYMDMLDDSMDGSGVGEEETKFYEADGSLAAEKPKKNFSPSLFDQQQREELLQLENFDEITMAKMQWRWDKSREAEKDQEKYLKLLKWIQASLSKEEKLDSNNNCQISSEDRRPKNRKRRHSTCQNFLETKPSRSQDLEFTYGHMSQSPLATALIEDNLFVDAAKLLKVNFEKILLYADQANGGSLVEHNKDENGANYYRNILQQQHALIKQMDLARPLTR